ncbi:two pore channel protein 2-like [Antedon mediterranea]|uniref:two pore channel protein 2-like n=1 Tax=Antedon mediterranea TaxID=105859 RepID=UPI003AF7401B
MATEEMPESAYSILTNSMYSSTEIEHELLSGRDDRSDLCNPESLLQAVVFVEDAVKFRSIYHKVDIKSLWYYRLYYSPVVQWFISTAICVILLLAFFENPSSLTWSSDPRKRGERVSAPCGLTEGIEFVCLLIFAVDVCMKAYLIGKKQFIKQKWLSAYVLVILASLIDWIVTVNFSCEEPLRVRRLLRPFFLLQNSSLMKKTVRSIKNTLPEVFSVILLVLLHLYFFTMVGLIMFSAQTSTASRNSSDTDSNSANIDGSEASEAFSSIGNAYMSLLVLLTTANNPDVMMPAYKENRMYALFFIIFLTIGLYCFFNMLTAVIYNQFRGYLQTSIQASFFRQRLGIRAAFEIMRRQGKGFSNRTQIRNTIPVSIVKSVILQVKMKKVFKAAIIRELDDNMGGFVTSTDFRSLFDVLDTPIRIKKEFPKKIFRHSVLNKIQSCVSHQYFAYFGSFVAVVNVFCITVEMGLTNKEKGIEDLVSALNFIFIIYYVVELMLKIWMLGWQKYFSTILNIIDFLVVVSLFVVEIAYASSVKTPFYSKIYDSHVLFVLSRVINLLILVRLFRIVTHIKPMAIVVWTTLDLIRNLRAFAGILVVIYYFFAILGTMVFNGKITFKDRDMNRTTECGTYEQLNYWANNFDDFAAALVVLWDVMLVNNWHIFLEAYKVYVSKWAQIYFILWYFVSVLVCLNLFAALIIENFITKWDRYHIQEQEDQQTMYMLNVHAMFRHDLKEPSEDDLMDALRQHNHLNL